MHATFFVIGLGITLLYLAFVLSLYTGMGRLKRGMHEKKEKVSIVVSARNEEHAIGTCLDALVAQDYPEELLEIIIVNDRSEDETRTIIDRYVKRCPRIKVIDIKEIPGNFAPKKFALNRGIEEAGGDIICTTDADCVPPPAWVSEMVACFTDDVGFVAGFSPLHLRNGAPGIVADYLFMDSIGLAAASAGGIGWGMPWTCAGRNLAYRKEAFTRAGGFTGIREVISGDDDLLMLLIHRNTGWRLAYALGGGAAVPSFEDFSIRRFMHQRSRHSSKFLVYPLRVQTVAVVIFLFYLAFLAFPLAVISTGEFLSLYMFMAGGKFVTEYLTVFRGARLFGAEFRFAAFLKTYLIHPVVITFSAVAGTRGDFVWKGRRFGRGKSLL